MIRLLFYLLIQSSWMMPAESLLFYKNGKEFQKTNLKDLKNKQPIEVLNVFEPHEGTQKRYKGFSVIPLISSVYGSIPSDLDTLVFYCSDGYRSDISLKDFKEKKATLSFAMADEGPFVLSKEKKVSLGPFYLTWDHPDEASSKKNFYRWPYGINKVDLINSKTAYKNLIPANGSDMKVTQGHQQYLKHCFSCHSLNGTGGERGPSLNYFIKNKSDTELLASILNPKSLNKYSQMSGLPKDLKDRDKIAKDILLYLKKQSMF